MKQALYVLLGSLLLISQWSCDLINPEEPIPAYLRIEPFTLSTTASQGPNTENIKQGWLFVNGEFLGAYDLPAEVPVLAVGLSSIRIEAGIHDNGISTTPDIYPFYEPYEEEAELVPGETTVLSPSTRYLSRTKFAFIEDFEDGAVEHFTEAITGGVNLEVEQDMVRSGQFAGRFSLLDSLRPIVEIATAEEFSGLQGNGVFVYLEIDYLAEAPVFWGVAGERDAISGLERYIEPGFAPKAEWNKIYLNLSQDIFNSQLETYKIIMQALLREEDPDSANVYLDNIKLVHF
ncbi:MAG: hypothetical protein D6772_12140 [Bacteroidetes bacterium]|nr:MAG: hypothetical protein D6772_12140 [Bacteroidota bacterium]